MTALSGALMCQYQRFADIGMGSGTIVVGLAAVILGRTLFGRFRWIQGSLAVIFGSILYKASIAVALKLGLPASDMKLITAILFIAVIVLRDPGWREKVKGAFRKGAA